MILILIISYIIWSIFAWAYLLGYFNRNKIRWTEDGYFAESLGHILLALVGGFVSTVFMFIDLFCKLVELSPETAKRIQLTTAFDKFISNLLKKGVDKDK